MILIFQTNGFTSQPLERILNDEDIKASYSNSQGQNSIGLNENIINQSDGFKIKNYFLSINSD